MGLLDLKKGVAGCNTPPKVYLVALERFCGSLTMLREKLRSPLRLRIEKLLRLQKKSKYIITTYMKDNDVQNIETIYLVCFLLSDAYFGDDRHNIRQKSEMTTISIR